MTKIKFSRAVIIAVIVGAFGMGGLLEKGAKMGGPVGSIAEFGSSITEMQDHISGLQKNLDTFKKVQSSLTGK